MPNPSILDTVIEHRFDIARGWRVAVRFEKGDGYRAQLERLRADQWEPCGPVCLESAFRTVCAPTPDGCPSFVRGRDRAAAIRVAGCPTCGYPHITLRSAGDGINWHCAACGGSGNRPAF